MVQDTQIQMRLLKDFNPILSCLSRDRKHPLRFHLLTLVKKLLIQTRETYRYKSGDKKTVRSRVEDSAADY
jgi:hypothetical protein